MDKPDGSDETLDVTTILRIVLRTVLKLLRAVLATSCKHHASFGKAKVLDTERLLQTSFTFTAKSQQSQRNKQDLRQNGKA